MVAARYRRSMTIAAATVIWTWHLGNDVPNLLATWRRFRPPAVDLGAWVVVSAVALVATWWLRRPERVGTRALPPWTLAAVLLVTEAVTLAACPPAERFGAGNWIWGVVGWVAVPLFWHRRSLTDLLLFLGMHTLLSGAVLLEAIIATPAALGQYLMVQYGTSSLQLAVAVGSRATGSAARWAADASAATARVTTRRIAALAANQTRRERYRTIRDGARGVLAGLAAGTLDPAADGVRQRCAVEAARLRRLLAENDDVPEPLLHELRACADIAERRGVEVELVAVGRVPDLPAVTRRRLAEPPISVLASARSHARITVAALPDDVAVSVVADTRGGAGDSDGAGDPNGSDEPDGSGVPNGAGDPEGSGGPEPGCGGGQVTVIHHRKGTLLWTQTRWRDPSASLSSTTTPS